MTTNSDALRARCKLLCNTCYADHDVLEAELQDHLLIPDMEYNSDNDRTITACALNIVSGWVETARSEGGSRSHGGISVSTDLKALERNMLRWIRRYGFDPSDYGLEPSEIDNGSCRW